MNKLPPLSPQAQADLWRYIEHLERWRQSIGYEIHDGLTQQITAALLFLESYEQNKPDSTSLERCRSILQEALAESRRLIEGLNPKGLDEEGLAQAVQEFLAVPSPFSAAVEVDIDEDLPCLVNWQRSTLFRFLQEAITNARKHSAAKRIRVSAHATEGTILAQVVDDGLGFDLETATLAGHGLQGLSQKAEMLQAELTVDSQPGKGTTLTLRVPVNIV